MLCEVPLTKEQQEFAAEHHGLVYKFLNDNHLSEDECKHSCRMRNPEREVGKSCFFLQIAS